MSSQEKYLKILSAIMPAGMLGASLLLGSTAPSAAHDHPVGVQPSASDQLRVSERLAAIREAVSSVALPGIGAKIGEGDLQLAWGNLWNNFGWGGRRGWGWGRPWNNWRNGPRRWNNWWPNW